MDMFPELYSQRLQLRKITVEDIPSLVRYANNRKIADQVFSIPYPYGEPEAVFRISYVVQGFKNKARYVFAIINRENEELVGEIGLHLDNTQNIAQLGYWVGEPFWGQGIATEATATVLKFGFERLDLSMIYAECVAENTASVKVLLKNGMSKGTTTARVEQYSLTRSQFEEQGR